MAFSATRSSLAEHATVPTPTMTTLCLPSGVQSVAVIGTIKDARPIEPTPTRTERSSSEWGDRRRGRGRCGRRDHPFGVAVGQLRVPLSPGSNSVPAVAGKARTQRSDTFAPRCGVRRVRLARGRAALAALGGRGGQLHGFGDRRRGLVGLGPGRSNWRRVAVVAMYTASSLRTRGSGMESEPGIRPLCGVVTDARQGTSHYGGVYRPRQGLHDAGCRTGPRWAGAWGGVRPATGPELAVRRGA